MTRRFLSSLLFAAMIPAMAALAANEKGLSPPIPLADRQAIQDFPLNDDTARRLLAVSVAARAAHIDEFWTFAQVRADSLDDLADRVLTPRPRLARIVKQEGFSEREYIAAMYALASARQLALNGPDNPEAPGRDQFVSSRNASVVNVAYYNANRPVLDAIAVDGVTPPRPRAPSSP